MKKLVIEVSIRDTRKAQDAISDCCQIDSQLEQIASNVWESSKHFDEWDDEDTEEMEQLSTDIEEQLQRFGVEEIEINEEEV